MWSCLYNNADVYLNDRDTAGDRLKTDDPGVQCRRSSHSIACLDNSNTLVVFGGEHRPREPVKNDTLLFDRNRGVWNTVVSSSVDCPTERLGHVAVGLGSSTMLLHGGRSQVDESSTLGDLYSFDLGTGSWSVVRPKGSSSAVPAARNFHAACGVGDSIMYIFGGCAADGRQADLWRFDVRTGAWEELARHPTMRGRGGAGLAATRDGKQLFVIGGFTGQENGEVYRFDVAQNTWEDLHVAQPDDASVKFTPRSVFGVGCSRENHILVFGGEVDPSDLGHAGAGMFDNTLFSLDTRSGCRSWNVVSQDTKNTPCPRGWAASCASEDGMVLHGGIDVDNNRLGDLYAFDYNVV